MGTREAIRRKFMRIYAQERLDRITVKGLCAAVPVARTTFYAHYRNVDDVRCEVEDRLLAGLAEVAERVSGGDLQQMDFGTFLDETFGFIRANWQDFQTLLVTQPDLRFIARWKAAVKANFARRYPEARMCQNWGLLAEMGASATIGAYTWWMQHPDASGVDEAKRQIERAISAIIVSL
ncbi:MAG: hypothetical protein IJ092_01720 [Atopobiaceae bacterium]|nr:hypothetical protein [Atopobiaceae bacterium]